LSAIARLDPASPNSVELGFPNKDQAKDMIVAHLDYYRINADERGTITPFTETGLSALIEDKDTVHPRVLLKAAANVVQAAAREGLSAIEDGFVRDARSTMAQIVTTPDLTEGLDAAL
jgi:hypothetical protein